MSGIHFKCELKSTLSSPEIRDRFLDLSQWPSFTGWGPIPGIQSARYTQQTESTLGSVILVQNSDGSSHQEEIIEWVQVSPNHFRFVIRLNRFTGLIRLLAPEFIESWEIKEDRNDRGASITRSFELIGFGFVSRFFLRFLIAPLFKKAIQSHLEQSMQAPD
jgi:hypothetical protein